MIKTVLCMPTNCNKSKPSVSVIYSFYNEQNVVEELVQRTRNSLIPLKNSGEIASYEMVFVNDNSSDSSRDKLIELMREENDILLIDMARNFGVSECVLAGFSYSNGDVVIYLDADLQDPPELIPELIREWKGDPEAEIVYTTRRKRSGEHPLKMALTKFGYRLINRLSDIELPIDSGDFKLLSRRAVNHVLSLNEQRPYLRGMISWIGFKQRQVFYDRDPRADGRNNTKFPVLSKRVIYGYLDRALISYSDAPLKLMLFLGVIVSLSSFFYLIVVIIQKFLGLYVPGWPAIMVAILFLGGIQLSVIGVIGLYINSIYLQVKRRPLTIIDKITGCESRVNKIEFS